VHRSGAENPLAGDDGAAGREGRVASIGAKRANVGGRATGTVRDESETPGPMDVALAMLGRRSQPIARVRERLVRRFGPDEADRVIARLLELCVLDDARYAESFVRDRFGRAGYGRERIRADLGSRGVSRGDIETAIAALLHPDAERAAAERALERFKRLKGDRLEPRKLRESAFRHLIARGFPLALVRDLLGSSL
jgi:regulatory protein